MRIGEIPLIMLLQYFYVERPLGSDGFFDNSLIATNNIVTSFEIGVLSMATTDIIVDNLIDSKERPLTEAEGVGAPDGRIDVMESLIIIDTACITTAAIIRIVVNSLNSLNWSERFLENNMTSNGCLSFDWNTEVFFVIDWIYLVLCLIPLVSVIFVVWSFNTNSFILSKIIIYQHQETDERLMEQFETDMKKDMNDEEFFNLVLKYEEMDLRFILFARGKQNKFLVEKMKSLRKNQKTETT